MKLTQLADIGNGQVRLKGELSFISVPDLWKHSQRMFTASEKSTVVIDLAEVEKVDSAGLALLVAWSRLAKKSALTLQFIHVPPKLIALAQANKLDDLLGLDAT